MNNFSDTKDLESNSEENFCLEEHMTLNEDLLNDTLKPSPEHSQYASLYKALTKNRETSQSERREQFLKEIRKRRNDTVDHKRCYQEDVNLDVEMVVEETEEEPVDCTHGRRKSPFRNKLTFNEWFCEIPLDLEQNWLVKFCPFGKRCLVVAQKHQTICYDRKGVFVNKFQSNLPGGGSSSQRNKYTMLECLYNFKLKCYFVLDALYWNSIPLRKYDAEFRFYWLKSKFEESPDLSIQTRRNSYPFHLLDYIPAIPNTIGERLNEIPVMNGVPLPYDGLLFYHIESVYISGFTPLVGWLKPYMVTELFGINVHSSYLEKIPKGYTTLQNYVKSLDRVQRRTKKGNAEDDNLAEMDDSCASETLMVT